VVRLALPLTLRLGRLVVRIFPLALVLLGALAFVVLFLVLLVVAGIPARLARTADRADRADHALQAVPWLLRPRRRLTRARGGGRLRGGRLHAQVQAPMHAAGRYL